MGELLLAILIVMICWSIFKHLTSTTVASNISRPPSQPPNDSLLRAQAVLVKAMDLCAIDHRAAVNALVFMAASDGTVSRQELRIIIGFCERQGTQVNKEWIDACERLNSGLTMSIDGDERDANANIAKLADKPIRYRAAFLGATEAIAASNKTTNATKLRLIERARDLV